jgi:hypothetical protein
VSCDKLKKSGKELLFISGKLLEMLFRLDFSILLISYGTAMEMIVES